MHTLCFPNFESFFSLCSSFNLEYSFLFTIKWVNNTIHPLKGSSNITFSRNLSELSLNPTRTVLAPSLAFVTFLLEFPSLLFCQILEGSIHVDYLCVFCVLASGTLVLNIYSLVLKSDFRGIYIH